MGISKSGLSIGSHEVSGAGVPGGLVNQGTISIPAEFPVSPDDGAMYLITADVTDSDGTKTNTGKNFYAGATIYWDGTTWQIFTYIPDTDDRNIVYKLWDAIGTYYIAVRNSASTLVAKIDSFGNGFFSIGFDGVIEILNSVSVSIIKFNSVGSSYIMTKLGINTTTPQAPLDIQGSIREKVIYIASDADYTIVNDGSNIRIVAYPDTKDVNINLALLSTIADGIPFKITNHGTSPFFVYVNTQGTDVFFS